MATRPIYIFSIMFLGDGSDTTFTIDMVRGPLSFQTASGFALSPQLDAKPAEIEITASTLTIASSSYDAGHGILTVVLASAPVADTQYTLIGYAKY